MLGEEGQTLKTNLTWDSIIENCQQAKQLGIKLLIEAIVTIIQTLQHNPKVEQLWLSER